MDSVLNNLQKLICHKTQITKQPSRIILYQENGILLYVNIYFFCCCFLRAFLTSGQTRYE